MKELELVKRRVCEEYGITEEDLCAKRRTSDLTQARALFINICLEAGMPMHSIAKGLKTKPANGLYHLREKVDDYLHNSQFMRIKKKLITTELRTMMLSSTDN